MYARNETPQAITGSASNKSATGSRASSSTTSSPRQQADSVPTVETMSTRPSCEAENRPSATAITAVTSNTPTACATTAARSAANQVETPCSPTVTIDRNTSRPRPDDRESSARLNHTLIGFCRRFTTIATPAPTSCAASSPAGETKNRPSVSAISEAERVCACLRNCRCTT